MEKPHRRQTAEAKELRGPTVELDYAFPYGAEGPTLLKAVDVATGYAAATLVKSKGAADGYSTKFLSSAAITLNTG